MKAHWQNLIIFLIFAVFFGFLLVTGEPISVGDTFQHENQMVMREPGYALLIQFLRFISPQSFYWLIIIVQNMLAVAANTFFIVWMKKHFRLHLWIALLFTAILLVPHILTPVFSSTHFILTNALMTEGILFSLYPLAMLCLLNAIWSNKPLGKESIGTLLFFLLLSLIRGQMMVLFIVWFIVMAAVAVVNGWQMAKRKSASVTDSVVKQGLLVIVVLLIVAFVVRVGIIRVYNYCENGLFVDTASGKAMSFANVLYVADREDGAAITDETLQGLFYEMYDAADADKMNYKYAKKGILNKATYHEKCHDELNFTYFGEPAKRYVGETMGIYTDRYQELMIAVDDVAAQLSSALMPQVLGRYIENYIAVIVLGFIRTVAYEYPPLVWYSLLIYIVAAVLTIFLWKKNHTSITVAFMAVMLLTIVGNVCATALMIQCISRYMIYNLPLFYMAGFLELLELFGTQMGMQRRSHTPV